MVRTAAVGALKRCLMACSWPAYLPDRGEKKDVLVREIAPACNLWRNFEDIRDSWASVQGITNFWARNTPTDILVRAAGPGHWNDPDMLYGQGRRGYADPRTLRGTHPPAPWMWRVLVGNNGLSLSEQQSQFALWAILAAPLYMTADLRRMPFWARTIVKNKMAISVNQDALGKQGYVVWSEDGVRIWIKELRGTDRPGDTWAVLLQNTNDMYGPKRVVLRPAQHIPGWEAGTRFWVRDIFHRQNVGRFKEQYSAEVDPSS
ncbi:hypothetical protein FOZ63_033480, partial [Perkinsus olseni]